ncbi:MAG: transposase [Desulfobulbus sp.]|nr:transposase [Desulfobulbus sp.]
MRRRFHKPNRSQLHLLPISIDQWVEEDHLARFLWDCVEHFNLGQFYAAYGDEGAPPYDPQMMLAVLLYAWCLGIRSSRRIAQACEDQVPFRWLTGNLRPDHCAFARFRSRHEEAINHLFAQVLSLCHEAGLAKVGKVYLDGTKMQASASLAANRTLAHLEQEIVKMQAEMKDADAADDARHGKDRRGDELPPELRSKRERLARLQEAKERLELVATAERLAQESKLATRAEEERQSGKKKPGRKPASPDSAVNHERKANPTDPASRIMKTSQGHVQGFNAQAIVTAGQCIVSAEVTQDENDVHQLEPMLAALAATLEAAGIEDRPQTLAADAGYWHDQLEVTELEQKGPALFIATASRLQEAQAHQAEGSPQGRIPDDITPKQRMARKLRTKVGRAVYKLRSQTVEPVFGQIKSIMGCRSFLRRGLEAVQSEWSLICACFNLRKLYRAAYGD